MTPKDTTSAQTRMLIPDPAKPHSLYEPERAPPKDTGVDEPVPQPSGK